MKKKMLTVLLAAAMTVSLAGYNHTLSHGRVTM